MKRIKVILVIVLCVAVIGGIAATLLTFGNVTVMFDSGGGTEIAKVKIAKGDSLGALPEPQRGGYDFLGWFYEENNENYLEDDVFEKNTTLHAKWVKDESVNYNVEHLGDVVADVSFVVSSTVKLTNDNLSDYISLESYGPSAPSLKVTAQDSRYEIKADEGFDEGATYTISIRDEDVVSFINVGGNDVTADDVLSYTFSIAKEEVYDVVEKKGIEFISTTKLLAMVDLGEATLELTGNDYDVGKTVYGAYIKDLDISVSPGDIINLAFDDPNAGDAEYYRILSIDMNSSYEGATAAYLTIISPALGEVFDSFSAYSSDEEVDISTLLENSEEIVLQVSEQVNADDSAYSVLLSLVTDALKNSPTVQKAIKDFSPEEKSGFYALSTREVFKTAAVVNFGAEKLGSGGGVTLSISTGDVILNLPHDIKVSLNLTIKDTISVNSFYDIRMYTLWKVYWNSGVDVTNNFSFSLSAGLSYNKVDENSETVDISDELENLVENAVNPTQAFADEMNKGFMTEKLDYQDIASASLGSIEFTVKNILCFKVDLSAVVSLGCHATVDFSMNYSTTYRIGNYNGYIVDTWHGESMEYNDSGRMQTYKGVVRSDLNYDFSFKGKMGIRAGLRLTCTMSVFKLYDRYSVGISAEIGAYLEVSGYVDVTGSKDYGASVTGGVKLEVGLYTDINIFWNFYPWSGSHNLFYRQWPLFTISTDQKVIAFEATQENVVINTNEYNLASAEHLKISSVNMFGPSINGVSTSIVTTSTLDPADCSFGLFSTAQYRDTSIYRWVSVTDDGYITIKDGAPERLDFAVKIYYMDGKSCLSPTQSYMTKVINFTYATFDGDVNQTFDVSFHDLSGAVVKTDTYYVGQRVVIPRWLDVLSRQPLSFKYNVDYDNFWVTKNGEAYGEFINEDRDYYINTTPRMYNVEYYGYVYNEETKEYEQGLLATVEVAHGESPVAPATTDNGKPSYMVFSGWDESTNPYYRRVYHSDDSSWYLCHRYYARYTDTRHKITFRAYQTDATHLVEDGKMPTPPDTSDFNRDGFSIIAWTPQILPATQDATYRAIYVKDYGQATFTDRYGNVIDVQSVKRGELPVVPDVQQTYPGEQPYYEYYFTGFSPKVEECYYVSQTYRAIYARRYIDCTIVFDPEGRALEGGSQTTFTGGYEPGNENNPLFRVPSIAAYRDNSFSYTLLHWQRTEHYNDAYQTLMPQANYNYAFTGRYKPVFSKSPITYSVTFAGDGKTLTLTGSYGETITEQMLYPTFGRASTETVIYTTDYGVSLPYAFGSETGADGFGITSLSKTVTCTETPAVYSATFEPNGGWFSDASTAAKTRTGAYNSTQSYPVGLTRTGYEFLGWSTNPDATTGESSSFSLTHNVTYYAIWKPERITIYFDVNTTGGHFADPELTAYSVAFYGDYGTYVQQADAQTCIAVKDNGPESTVYEFVGWNTDPEAYTGIAATDIMFETDNTTYYAIFVESNTVVVSFNAGGDAYIYDFWAAEGRWKRAVSIKSPEGASLNYAIDYSDSELVPIKPGSATTTYVFDGWYNARGEKFTDATSFSENASYTARFTSTPKQYKVSFAIKDGELEEGYCYFVLDGSTISLRPWMDEEGNDTVYTNSVVTFTDGTTAGQKNVEGGFSTEVNIPTSSLEATLTMPDATTYTTTGYLALAPEDVNATVLARLKTLYGWEFTVRSYVVGQDDYGDDIIMNFVEYIPGSFTCGAAAMNFYEPNANDIVFVGGSIEDDTLVIYEENRVFSLEFTPVFAVTD